MKEINIYPNPTKNLIHKALYDINYKIELVSSESSILFSKTIQKS